MKNRIYNNLSVDNLMKTEKFKQLNKKTEKRNSNEF